MRFLLLTAFAVPAVVGTVWITGPGATFSHNLGTDSVDDCEIRWDDHTQYDTARHAAEQAWENLAGSDRGTDHDH